MNDQKPNHGQPQPDNAASSKPSSPESNSAAENTENALDRCRNGKFARGNSGGPGRHPGVPNRVNAILKDDILVAYEERGGIEYLRALSDRDFVRLLEKVMPREIAADIQVRAEGMVRMNLDNMCDEDLERLGHSVGRVVRRIDGQVVSFDDADAALSLSEIRAMMDPSNAHDLGPLALERLVNVTVALRKHLPELAKLLPQAEAMLLGLRRR